MFGYQAWLFAGAYRQPLHPGARWHREAEMVPWHAGRGGSKNVAKCFENLPAFLRKDFRNLLPRFARGGTTIARHCDFLSPLDPFLGSLAYRRVSLVTARFLCGFMPLYPWHAVRGKVSCSVFRRQALCCPQSLRHACRGGCVCCHCGMSIRSIGSIRSILPSVS